MRSLVEGALFYSPRQFGFAASALILLATVLTIKLFLRRLKFLQSVKWIPGPPGLPFVGNALTLAISQDGKCFRFISLQPKKN